MYGVNTGFGELAHVAVPPRHMTTLQVNLLRGHAGGTGTPFGEPVVRAILTARINALARGYSGVAATTLKLMVDMLNAGIHPVIPEQGSLGASGDLAPLSHMALPLIGEGEVTLDGERLPAAVALDRHGLKPVILGFKEGLALINGTSAMTGAACIALADAYARAEVAILLSGLVTECLRGSTRAFDARGHELKGHRGQIRVAACMRSLLAGSQLTREHAELMSSIEAQVTGAMGVVDTGVYIQNAYALRCIPQILGPVLDTLDFCRSIIERELNSCNDNPLILDSADASFHGGNFHGQYVAAACDYLAIALTEIGVLAERQLNRLVDPALNGELPDFLALSDSGLACGFMGAQYTATSIASENLDLAAPSSVKSIPSNGQNQDVVSMGLNAARRCLRLNQNLAAILAVLGGACYQAAHLLGAGRLSPAGQEWFTALSKTVHAHDESESIDQLLTGAREFHQSGPGERLARRYVGLVPDLADRDSRTLPQ
jgi:histidine ammonia-lyase/tyrosine ammonia-lyase